MMEGNGKKLFGIQLIQQVKSTLAGYSNIDANGKRFCLWCGKDLLNVRKRRYCSSVCYRKFKYEFIRNNYWMKERREVLQYYNFTCSKCGAYHPKIDVPYAERKLEVHHIVPKSANGIDSFENYRILCLDCHKPETLKQIKKLAFLRKFGKFQQKIVDFINF